MMFAGTGKSAKRKESRPSAAAMQMSSGGIPTFDPMVFLSPNQGDRDMPRRSAKLVELEVATIEVGEARTARQIPPWGSDQSLLERPIRVEGPSGSFNAGRRGEHLAREGSGPGVDRARVPREKALALRGGA